MCSHILQKRVHVEQCDRSSVTGALLLLSLLPELGPLVLAAPAVPAAPPAAQSSGIPGAALPGIPCVGRVLPSAAGPPELSIPHMEHEGNVEHF